MKKITLFLLILFLAVSISYAQQESEKIETRVLFAKGVEQGGNTVNRNSKIKLTRIPPIVRNDFFVENKLVLTEKGVLVLLQDGSQRTVDYNNFMNEPKFNKIGSFSANASTKGGNKSGNNCNDSISDYELSLKSLSQKSNRIANKECLKKYFSNLYFLLESDTIILENKSLIDSIEFVFKPCRITLPKQNEMIVINSIDFPAEKEFELYVYTQNNREKLTEGRIVNINKLFNESLDKGFFPEEILRFIEEEYFSRNLIYKYEEEAFNRIVEFFMEKFNLE